MTNILNYLITAAWQGKAAVQASSRDLGGLAKVGKGATRSLTELKSGVDLLGDAFSMTGQVITEFYGALSEGAALEAEQKKYENLAQSIGTSAAALTGELIPATKGMVTNAELVRGASDLISLGLADSQEEVVRWSSAVSALDLDLQVLGLTLANDSTARLDSLGLSMQDVNKLTEKFIAQGYEAGEAFDLAVLEALEDRMELLGDASETTAGKLQRAEVAVGNLTDKGKLFLAQRWEPIIGGLVDVTDEWAAAQADVDEALRRGIITEEEASRLVYASALGIQERQELLRQTRDEVQALIAEEERQNQVMADGQVFMDSYIQSRQAYNDQQRILTADADAFGWSLTNVTTAHVDHIAALADEQAAMEAAQASFASSMTVVSSLGGVIAEAYGAEAMGAEDAAGRIQTANAAISESYKQTAVDILQARLAETIEEDGLGAATAMIQFQEALGLITPEEATKLQEIAEKTELITSTTNTMLDTYMADGVLVQNEINNIASAVELIGANSTLTEEQIIALSTTGDERMGTLNEGAQETKDGFFDAHVEVGELKNKLWALPSKKTVDIYINTHGTVPSGLGDGGSEPPDGYRAAGGPVWPGGAFMVGERGPELFVPKHAGTIVPNGGGGGGRGVVINNYNNTREAAALAMAQAEQLRRQRLDRV